MWALAGPQNRPTISIRVEPLPPPASPTATRTYSPTPSTLLTAALTPVPSAGSFLPLQLNVLTHFVGLQADESIMYSLRIDTALVPNGFTVQLWSAGGDANLYVSNAPPPAGTSSFVSWQAASVLPIGLDTVTLTAVASAWLTAGGTYFIEVYAVTTVAFSLVALPLAPSVTPQSTATSTPPPTVRMTAAAPPPPPGTLTPLTLGVPFYIFQMPSQQSRLFRFEVVPSGAPFGFVVTLESAPGSNADLFLTTVAPADGLFVAQLQSTTAMPLMLTLN